MEQTLSRESVLETLRMHKGEILKEFPVKRLALFGSLERQKETRESDVDILVDVDPSSGYIALIERGGGVAFSVKVSNARDAGASGAIIYDNLFIPIPSGSYGGGNPYIPSVMTTRQVGLDLLALMNPDPVTVHLLVKEVFPVPEPTTILLLGLGLIGLA